MANSLLNPKVYANTMLAMMKNNLVFGRLIRGNAVNEFKRGVGSTVYVKRPPEFTVRTGPTVSIQDVVEGEVAVTIDQQKGVDIQWTEIESVLTADALLENRVMKSVAAQLAQTVDSAIAGLYTQIPNWVGTPGLIVDSNADFSLAPKRLDNLAVPADGRFAILSPDDYWGLQNSFSAIYVENVARDALTKAKLPNIGGVDPYMSQSMPAHTTGTRTNGTVSGAGQNVAYTAVRSTYTQTINLAGLGAGGTIKAGDVFTIAGVYAVNPRTKATLNFLAQFAVTTDATADGAGAATVTIRNPIITSGAYQTVSAAPANGAVVTWQGAANTVFSQSLVLREDAIVLASVKPSQPANGDFSYATDPETGIQIRYWKGSDVTNDLHTVRWDLLFGVNMVDARQGVRLSGS